MIDLSITLNEIANLGDRIENHNGRNLPLPKGESILNAVDAAQDIYNAVMGANLVWVSPHVSADENGDVAFEWWNNERTVVMYITFDDITYIKSEENWTIEQMIDGEIMSSEDVILLWNWLFPN